MEAFRYETTLAVTEHDYDEIHRIGPWEVPYRWLFLMLAAGLLCFLSPYTTIVGIVIMVILFIALLAPLARPSRMDAKYNLMMPPLDSPLTIVVTDTELRVASDKFDLRCGWPNVSIWDENGGWLTIKPHGMQALYLRVDDLKEASVYEQVIEMCKAHGKKFERRRAAV